ncbi:efflux transporter outer membrane subunit [Aquirhabdus sp.]|uniref:efflux transporter outer membrane subunit n=1 Tax=Aquirhabdus sp. TaxID=2824160 RepID=UPI00396C9AC3
MRRLLLCAAVSAVLASCTTVGPNYHRPADAVIGRTDANGAFLGSKNAALAQSAPPSEWWKLYKDPTLTALIEQTIKTNTDLRVAAANLARAQTNLEYADSSRHPEVSMSAGAEYARFSAEEKLVPTEGKALPNSYVYSSGISVAYQLDLFGQISRTIESAKADLGTAVAAQDATKITVIAETARAYMDACSTGHEIEVANKVLGIQASSTKLTQRLFNAGRGTSLDTTRSSGQEDQIRANMPLLYAQKRLALYRLAVLTGHVPADFSQTVAMCKTEPKLSVLLPVGDGMTLLKRRPDVRKAEYELHSATAKIGILTADLYPKVTFGASLGSVGLASHFLHDDTVSFGIGPLISWQFPERDRLGARIRGAEAEQQAVYAKFDGVVLNALRETESALETYARDLDRQAYLKTALDKARKSAKDSETLFKLGRQSYLPVLDADRTLATAEQSLASVEGKILLDQVAVFLALGGGWEPDTPAPKAIIVQDPLSKSIKSESSDITKK